MKKLTDSTVRLSQLKSQLSAAQYQEVLSLLENKSGAVRDRLSRLPFLLPILGAFGLVSTFYAFEKLLDRTVLVEQPLTMLGIGVALLLLTGAFYQKL